MLEPRTCPECHTELPADAPQALCPKCLLHMAMSDSDVNGNNRKTPETSAYQGRFKAPAPAELAAHFPQLELLALLGQGGMGAVYKARQKKLDRLVALKIMPPEVASDPAFAERFAREARALAKLNHPNIVAVHDYGQEGGFYYFIMEYVDGLNLRQLMEGKPVAASVALQIVPQVCDALQFAHDEELVHRDIKPENILIDKRGRVKIADFGLAKLVGPAPAFTLTGSHQIMGTPHYMAPEQMEKPSSVDHRADIYSLGVIFYEMLTGELPLGRFGVPSQKAEVDQRLDEIVLRALEKEPARRYQSISEVKTDVESIARTAPAFTQAGIRHGHVPAGFDREMIGYRITAPAAGLIVTGFLSFLSWAMVGVVLIMAPFHRANIVPPWDGLLVFISFLAIVAVVAASGILVVGGIKMMRLQSYGFAVTAAVCAMIPWSYAFLLGLPIGIWAMWVLRKPEVKLAFLGRRLGIYRGDPPTPSPKLAETGPVGGFFHSLRDFVFDSLARRESTIAGEKTPPLDPAPAPRQAAHSPAPSSELKAWVAAARPAGKEPASQSDGHGKGRDEERWVEEHDKEIERLLWRPMRNGVAVFGMVAIVLAVGWAILKKSPALLPWLPVIPFAGYYLWLGVRGTFGARIIAGVLGVIGTIGIVILAQEWSGREGAEFSLTSLIGGKNGIGWVSFALDFWFFTWLLGKKTGEEKIAAPDNEKEKSTLSGLSTECIEIRRLLLRFQEEFSCYVFPEFDADFLSVCRKACGVPPEERILGLIDLSGNENGDNVLLIGCQGVYFFNHSGSPQPGPGSVPYQEFSKRAFVNHGKEVYLGEKQFLYPDPDAGNDCEKLANLLNAVREVILKAGSTSAEKV